MGADQWQSRSRNMVCRSGGAFAKRLSRNQTRIIYPFQGFGENWNEANQQMLQRVQMSADYVNATSHQPYKEPSQLRNHTQFLLEHTDGALLLYDEEFPGKTSFFLKDAKKYREDHPYEIDQITMDDLQNATFDSNLL